MQYRAIREAAAAGEMVMYNQAMEVCRSERLERKDYRRALQVVNITNTGKLMGMLPLFRGMPVRLTAKLSAKHGLVQDAVGKVVGVEFDPREFAFESQDWRFQRSHPRRRAGYARLEYCPRGIYVKFDGLEKRVRKGDGTSARREPVAVLARRGRPTPRPIDQVRHQPLHGG